MKRNLAANKEAVSPVIAVILMVAITVVLAATVFVLVSDIGTNTSKTQPSMGWNDDEVNDEWKVNQAPKQVTWPAYSIKADGLLDPADTVTLTLNPGPVDAPTLDFSGDYVTLEGTGWTGTQIEGGDVLSFCSNAEQTDLTITLLHIDSNAVAHQYVFLNVDVCPP